MPLPPYSFHRFIADAMLGKLAKWMRLLGYDVVYEKKINDDLLVQRALAGQRVILTRDSHLILPQWLPKPNRILIEHDHLPEQLRQVVREFNLSVKDYLFTRCALCNSLLLPASPHKIEGIVPDYVRRTQSRFSECPTCRRIYWGGTHRDRIQEKLNIMFPDLENSSVG